MDVLPLTPHCFLNFTPKQCCEMAPFILDSLRKEIQAATQEAEISFD